MAHRFNITIPSVKDIGRAIGRVARNGYEGSITIPSAQQCVDGVCVAASTAARIRVRVKPREPEVQAVDRFDR